MRPEEIRKLLGGYATGTLTGAEQEALFTAALDDQDLFDTLAREQSLRDLLRDPAARAQLLAALDHRPAPWWSWRPAAALAGTAAVVALAAVLLWTNVRRPETSEMADLRPPVTPPAPIPAGPLVVMPPAGTGIRPGTVPMPRAFVRPKAPPPPPSPSLPEPPQAGPPRAGDMESLGGVIGGVPAATPHPQPPASATDSVQVQAASPALNVLESESQRVLDASRRPAFQARLAQPAGARAVFFGGPTRPAGVTRTAAGIGGAASPPANLGVRYSVLRKDSGGDFVEVDPGELKAGDTLELRFTANAAGYLSVSGATPVSLAAMAPYTTPPVPAGQQDLTVVFARQPLTAVPAPLQKGQAEDLATAAAGSQNGRLEAQQQAGLSSLSRNLVEAQDRATYVVSRDPGQPVAFSIKLSYK